MCGILGEFAFKGSLIEKEKFLSLLMKSRKRGPDTDGHFSNEKNLRLGFNRLAILDLTENAHQPIHSPSTRYSMVFNGEIYNHLELRNTLPDGKYHFSGHGDTESESHKTLPIVNQLKYRLEQTELLPYRMLIENGLGSVMVAHLYIPSLDVTASTFPPN